MTVAEYIEWFIVKKQIDVVFALQGGMITRLLDAISTGKTTRIVSMHHEQAVAMAVCAYGRVRGVPSIGFATSGPGATNLLTGIACCYFDSIPAIFITGQVNAMDIKGFRESRQIGFQETDIVSMARPITKGAYLAYKAIEIPSLLENAYEAVRYNRPGPVLIDIPINIQNEEV